MPTYVYEVLDKKGQPTGETFEIVQPMKEPPSPSTRNGSNVPPRHRRAAHRRQPSPLKSKGVLSNKNLERLGFTKYERKGRGTWAHRREGRAQVHQCRRLSHAELHAPWITDQRPGRTRSTRPR